MTLSVWAAVGLGGVAFGPLVGGMLLEYFYWGSVFLANVPIVLVIMTLTAHLVPRQAGRRDQSLNFGHTITLIVATLLLVCSAKTAPRRRTATVTITLTLLTGALLSWQFVRIQPATAHPVIDTRLFIHRIILNGAVMMMTAMVTLMGFELLMAQELQSVHGLTPYQAGLFMLSMILASGFSGLIAGMLVLRLGSRCAATAGMTLSTVNFYGLAMTDFSSQQIQAWILMALLGFSVASVLLASTAAIMAAALAEKAAAVDAIETTTYELGAGLGIAVFDLLLSRNFSISVLSPVGLNPQEVERAASSVGEAIQLAHSPPSSLSEALLTATREAFTWSHNVVLGNADSMFVMLTIGMQFSLTKVQH